MLTDHQRKAMKWGMKRQIKAGYTKEETMISFRTRLEKEADKVYFWAKKDVEEGR
jgi:hypothetical protein